MNQSRPKDQKIDMWIVTSRGYPGADPSRTERGHRPSLNPNTMK